MFRLLFDRQFGNLTIAQFFAAFNDNALKQIFLLLTVQTAMQSGSGGFELQAASMAVFALPFLLFSTFAGRVTDRVSKTTVIRLAKFIEIIVVLIAGWGIYAGNLYVLLVGLFLLSTQSCFFSPAKYGILPEIFGTENLSAGNGILQASTYAAIILGTAMAGVLLEAFHNQRWIISVVLIATALAGWIAAMLMEKTPPADPDQDLITTPLKRFAESLAIVREDRQLFYSMFAFAYFWFAGSVIMLNLNVYGMSEMGLSYLKTSFMLGALGVGVGAGCLLAGRLSGERIEPGLIPFGALGMGITLLVLVNVPSYYVLLLFWLFVAGVFSGLFLIPLQAILQERPAPEKKGEVLGAANLFTFTGVLISAAVYTMLVGWAGVSASTMMGLLGIMTLVAGTMIVTVVPRFFVRFVLWLLVHSIYRIDVHGRENIPDEGPALLVANHVSYI
ncbi:MAG: MFS transporter, partial [bacterium]